MFFKKHLTIYSLSPPHIYILNTIMTDLEDFEFFCTEKADQMASFLLDTLS